MSAIKVKGMNSRQWKIYKYLKETCVGQDNARIGDEIIHDLKMLYPSEFYSYKIIKHDIKVIRSCCDRRIGSNSKIGYWLMTSKDESFGLSYTLRNAISCIKTLVKSGVKKELFYKVLNDLDNLNLNNNQMTLKLTDFEQDVSHTLSDDLLEDSNNG